LSKSLRDDLFKYQAGIFKAWESPVIIVGGVDDHIHALFSLTKNHALKEIVEEIKKGNSKWLKPKAQPTRTFTGKTATIGRSRIKASFVGY
jgi:REP element-mobilizing transposase RayT